MCLRISPTRRISSANLFFHSVPNFVGFRNFANLFDDIFNDFLRFANIRYNRLTKVMPLCRIAATSLKEVFMSRRPPPQVYVILCEEKVTLKYAQIEGAGIYKSSARTWSNTIGRRTQCENLLQTCQVVHSKLESFVRIRQ